MQSIFHVLFNRFFVNKGVFNSFRTYLSEKEIFLAVKTKIVKAANKVDNVGFNFFNSFFI